MDALRNPIFWMVAAAALAVAGFIVGSRVGRPRPGAAPPESSAAAPPPKADDRVTRRAASLDALAEAVLITDADSRIVDCNSSALTLFDRHRSAVEDQVATALRRFDGLDQSEPLRIATERSVWVGEAWSRQPDGAMRLCHVRVVALRDDRALVVGFAESYRDVAQDRQNEQEFRDLIYGVRAFDAAGGSPSTSLEYLREEIRVLSEAFRDLDHVLRQYERLLPSLSADDPLAESIAGLASDARSAVTSVGVPALLEEIPRALARMRGHLQLLASGQDTGDVADAPDRDGSQPTGVRHEEASPSLTSRRD